MSDQYVDIKYKMPHKDMCPTFSGYVSRCDICDGYYDLNNSNAIIPERFGGPVYQQETLHTCDSCYDLVIEVRKIVKAR